MDRLPKLGNKPGIVTTDKGDFDMRKHFLDRLQTDPSKSAPIAAIESISALITFTTATTMHELLLCVSNGALALESSIPNAISLKAGCNLFSRFVRNHVNDDPKNFDAFKERLLEYSSMFAEIAKVAREKIAGFGVKALEGRETVLVHGYSRTLMGLLKSAAESEDYRAVVTRAEGQGKSVAMELRSMGVPVAEIEDEAVAHVMMQVNAVYIGAEAVFADGSCLNTWGSHNLAIAAQTYKKPFFVAAETHKHVDVFPISQYNIPGPLRQKILHFTTDPEEAERGEEDGPAPGGDFVPKKCIHRYITEFGLFTTQQVSDRIVMSRFE